MYIKELENVINIDTNVNLGTFLETGPDGITTN
jgi:hypothetical protein